MAKKKEATGGLIDPTRYDYATVRIAGKDGKVKHTKHNGDAVALAMLTFIQGGGDLAKVVLANKLLDKMKPHQGKNVGLFRMTLGHVLRGLVRNGTPVKIGDIMVKSLEQRIANPALKDGAKPAGKVKKAAKKAKRAGGRKKAAAAPVEGANVPA